MTTTTDLDPDRPLTVAERHDLAALVEKMQEPETRRRNAHAVARLTWVAPPREPGDPVSFPLTDPCPSCGGLVVYIGRGARPIFCGAECRAAHDAATRSGRRAEGLDLAGRAARQAAERVSYDPRPGTGSLRGLDRSTSRRTSGEDIERPTDRGSRRGGEHDDDGARLLPEDWTDRSQARRESDPAALWLREYHPEALADFPRALHVGRTSTP